MRAKLGKKFMAIMLSLSMAAAPLASSGITSYAATAEDNAGTQTSAVEQKEVASESKKEVESKSESKTEKESTEKSETEKPTEAESETKDETTKSDEKIKETEAVTELEQADSDGESTKKTEPESTKADESKTEAKSTEKTETEKSTESKDVKAESTAAGTTAAAENVKQTTASETKAAETKTASENGNPFGLSDENMPADYSQLFGESMLMTAADDDSSETDAPDISVSVAPVTQKGNYVIKYTTVAGNQRNFTITPEMKAEVMVLTQQTNEAFDDGTYYGFQVLSVAFAVTPEGAEEPLVFYADEIVSGFSAVAKMTISGDYLFVSDTLYSKQKDDAKNWDPYNATYTAGTCSFQITKSYGYYVAKVTKTKGNEGNKALLLVQTGDESLGTLPSEDAQQIRNTLARTDQFTDGNIELMEVPENPGTTDKTDYKQNVWNWIDSTAKTTSDESFTVIYYTGHGGSLSDGSSTIGLGGANTITASELKQHVSQLSGKVMLVIDCCYSGGLIMTTSDDEDSTVDVDSLYKQAQENAEKSMKTFVKEFKNAKTGSNSGSTSDESKSDVKGNPEYYIYTAASSYETSIEKSYGGEISVALGHALGYDRNDDAYNVFAADKDANSAVSAKELAEYIENSCTVATPSIYSANEKAALFTYGSDAGVPVVLSAEIADDGKDAVLADGSVSVKVDITNYDKANEITIDAMLGEVNAALDLPGDFENVKEINEDSILAYNENENEFIISAGKTETCEFKFTEDEAKKLKTGRFVVRVWDTKNVENYALADFYIGEKELAADPDPDAFALKKPGYVEKAANAVEVSKILPIDVAFDNASNKTGYAACTLTAKYYDLGMGASGYAKDGTDIKNASNEIVELSGGVVISDYDHIRPAYGRTQIGDSETNGSDYAYEWNVKDLENDHYYVLEISCDYDNGDLGTKSVTTFIKKVADISDKKVIGQQFIEMDDFFEIDLGGEYDGNTVKEVSEKLIDSLKKKTGEVELSYSIANSSNSGWWRLVNGKLEAMSDGGSFASGGTYVNRLVMQIPTDANAVFSDVPQVTVQGHSLYNNNQGNKTSVSSDGKTLTIFIQHKMLDVDNLKGAVKVYLAGTKTLVNDNTELKVGDEIDVYVSNGYSIYVYANSGLEKVEVSDKGFTGKRYSIVGDKTNDGYEKISFAVKRAGSWDSDSCTCGYYAYVHKVEKEGAGVSSVSAPTKTFYTIGSKLDTRGAEVTYYDGDGIKTKTMDLSAFMTVNNAKLYTKSGNSYTEWSDDILKQFGTYDLYIGYGGNYYDAFSVAVGYEQGASFKVDGSMTKNQGGEADYVDDKNALDIVLFLSGTWKNDGDGVKGTVKYTHSARLRSDGSNADKYEQVYPANGATISYLIPYADFMSITNTRNGADYNYEIVDADANVPVTFEKRADGLWVTAKRNGSFTIAFSIGGNGGNDDRDEKETQKETEKETQKETEKQNEINKRQSSSESSSSGSHSDRSSNEPTSKAVSGSWQKSSQSLASGNVDGYRFKLANGSYATGWQLINWNKAEHWFYFGQDGYMRTGWLKDAGKWYYLEKDGTMALGWHLENGSWYYLEGSGSMVTGWYRVGLNWYYFAADGKMQLGRQLINGTEYNFRADGSWISTKA